MRPAPRLCAIVTILFSLLGPAADLACAEELDPALLDACPGYNATSVEIDGPTLTAKLVLAGAPCNVFGDDIEVLDLKVVYETGRTLPQGGRVAFPTDTHSSHRCAPTHPLRNTHPSQDNRRV